MRSDTVKKGFERAPHRSLLRAVGLRDEDFDKPFVGIANSQVDIIPGHVHLAGYGRIAKEEIRKAGGVPFEFHTIGVDDGICGGRMRLIAFIAEVNVARRILDHLGLDSRPPPIARAQAPPEALDPPPVHDLSDPVFPD